MIDEPRIAESDEGFPALDFKFSNSGGERDLLTRIVIEVDSASADLSPCLHYQLWCRDGNLVLAVFNDGWGEARDFAGSIDLRIFGAAVHRRRVDIPSSQIPAAVMHNLKQFVLLEYPQLDLSALPAELRGDEGWLPYTLIPASGSPSGIKSVPGVFSYASADGHASTEEIPVSCGYGKKIYVLDGRLKDMHYSWPIQASRIVPSCLYHFMLDPESGQNSYEKSVAHVVQPGGYDRLWLVLASTRPAFYYLRCHFVLASGATVRSPWIKLHIWFQSEGAHWSGYHELTDIAYPYRRRRDPDYDVSALRRRTPRRWQA